MFPTDEATMKILRLLWQVDHADAQVCLDIEHEIGAIAYEVAGPMAPELAGRNRLEQPDVLSEIGLVCTLYAKDLVSGEEELPRCVAAVLRRRLELDAIDLVKKQARRSKRDAARFDDYGNCTPVGTAGEEVATSSIVYATTTSSHEDTVILRLEAHAAMSTMSHNGLIATVLHDAVGFTTEECCQLSDCTANTLYQRRYRAILPATDRWGYEAAA